MVGEDSAPPQRTAHRFSWHNHLREALLSLTYGHMFFEQVYRIRPDGLADLRKLGMRHPRTLIEIRVARDGGLEWIEQNPPPVVPGQSGPVAPVKIPVDRLVAYVHEQEGGNWLGESLLRSAYKNWLIKDRLLRVQAQTIDRNGMGIPVYEGAPGETDLSEGKKMATAYRAGESSGAAVPDGAKLRLLGVEGALPDADPVVRYHDEQIAKGALLHFLTLGTQTGSWALGTTFADFFVLSLQTEAEFVRDVGQAHVVEDIVDVNWGPDEPAPQLIFEEIGGHQQATAAAIKQLVDAKILFPDRELEEFLRRSFGLPGKASTDPAPAEQ